MNNHKILITEKSSGYELIDSGDGEKLERFGEFTICRPDPQALWKKNLGEDSWKADASFSRDEKNGVWSKSKEIPEKWLIDFGGQKMFIKLTPFKHTGLFPEQVVNWDWMGELISKEKDIEVLNLFGYTGGASLACARAGAKVVHVDSSKSAVNWARENAEASGLSDKPIRWILEDARLFVEREVKRGNKYDAIIMDPPAFGHGVNNEIWKIEEHFVALVDNCISLLKDKPLFFLINGYSAGYSAIAYQNILRTLIDKFGGNIEVGELTLKESGFDNGEGRLLPCGIFSRWSK